MYNKPNLPLFEIYIIKWKHKNDQPIRKYIHKFFFSYHTHENVEYVT